MKAQELRKGDVFNGKGEGHDPRLGGGYVVIGDAEILPWPAQPGGDPGPARSRKGVRVLVKFPDGGTEARWFEIGQEVAHTRPTVAGSKRYRDYADRMDLVICGDCSTRAKLALIPRDEQAAHDGWHRGSLSGAPEYFDAGPLTTTQDRYAVVEGRQLRELAQRLSQASAENRVVRFTVHNGLKYDAGNGWSASVGRPANELGH